MAGSRVSKQVFRKLSLSILVPCLSLSDSLSLCSVTGDPQQLLASISPAQQSQEKGVPVSQWHPLVSRGGVSPDIFGHVLSLWPGESSAHLQKVGREQGILVLPKSHGLKRQVGVCVCRGVIHLKKFRCCHPRKEEWMVRQTPQMSTTAATWEQNNSTIKSPGVRLQFPGMESQAHPCVTVSPVSLRPGVPISKMGVMVQHCRLESV